MITVNSMEGKRIGSLLLLLEMNFKDFRGVIEEVGFRNSYYFLVLLNYIIVIIRGIIIIDVSISYNYS